jgi:peptide/nickel transport system permease protein
LINCPAPSLGYSFQQHACVTNLIGEALPVTFSLAIGAIVMWLALGIGLGILAARFRGRIVDRLSTIFVLIGTSLPTFLTGLLLLVFVVIRWGLIPFPSGNYTSFFENPFEWAQILFLPWLTLAFAYAALYTRFVRSSVIDTSNEDYIRTAHAKGLTNKIVLMRHALRNAAVPIVTVIGIGIALLIGGVVVTESVFSIPGLGRLTVDAVLARDFPTVQALVLLFSLTSVMVNLLIDLSYTLFDPRIRY